jgi:hypothetical protein
MLGKVRGHDLVTVESHPYARDLGAAVRFERDQVGEGIGFQEGAGVGG